MALNMCGTFYKEVKPPIEGRPDQDCTIPFVYFYLLSIVGMTPEGLVWALSPYTLQQTDPRV